MAHKRRRKWCPLARIWFLHMAMELHISNSNLPSDVLILTTWHLVFHWDLLPTFYIMEPWALILYHLQRAIVFGEALFLYTCVLQMNKKTLGFIHDCYSIGALLESLMIYLYLCLWFMFHFAHMLLLNCRYIAILHLQLVIWYVEIW